MAKKPEQKTPYKHLSGAQKRKKRKEREGSLQTPSNWQVSPFSDEAYKGAGYQWDPDAPPVELPLYGMAPSTVAQRALSIITQLEQGQFYAPSFQWDAMLRDERIASALQVRISGLLGQQLEVLPGEDSEQGKKVKEKYEKQLGKIFPNHQLAQLCRNGYGLSTGIAQVLSARGMSGREAKIKVWSNRYLRWDWMLRKYRLVTENRGEITVEEGDPEWLVYEPFGPLGWLHGALLRSLMQPWLIRFWTREWWARRQEVHGQPIRLGIIPMTRKPADERQFLYQLSNLAHEAVIRLPQGEDGNKFDVKLLEAQSGDVEGFEKLMMHCNESISIGVLGQHMSTDGQGGLGAQEKAGESTMVRVLRQDALLGGVLREQVLVPLVEDNEGRRELAPEIGWQVEPPEDRQANAEALKKVAEACNIFATVPGIAQHVDIRAVLEAAEVPLLAASETPADVPGTPAPRPDDREDEEHGIVPPDTLKVTPDPTGENEEPDAVEPPPKKKKEKEDK